MLNTDRHFFWVFLVNQANRHLGLAMEWLNFCFFSLGRFMVWLGEHSSALIRGENIIISTHLCNKGYCCNRDDIFRTQILHNSLDKIFYMTESTYFSPVFWNCLRVKRAPNFLEWGGKPFLQNNFLLLWYPLLCISILKIWRTQILATHLISMHFAWFTI